MPLAKSEGPDQLVEAHSLARACSAVAADPVRLRSCLGCSFVSPFYALCITCNLCNYNETLYITRSRMSHIR